MGNTTLRVEKREAGRDNTARYKICEICGQIFDERDAEQVTHHTALPHEPLLRETRDLYEH